MKKILIYSTAILFSLLSFVGCKNGDDLTTEDAFNGTWQYTSTYSVVNGYNLSSSVTNGETYSFADNHVLYIIGDTVNQKGSYSVKDGIISYTDESGSYKTKEYKIQGNKLYIYESTTTASGATTEKGFILTRKSSVITTSSTGSASGNGSGNGSSSETTSKFVGTWTTINDYTITNGTTEKTDPMISYTIVLKSNGTMTISILGTEPQSGTYSVSGTTFTTTTSDGKSDSSTFKFVNGYLYLYSIEPDETGVQVESGNILKKQ